ncbi:hypothetical protein TRAPUB_13070 [Trametes pubescens]|uniref:WW domain-containing oxidoreductase n=1 Tax=Trametes pubescens TaxID=154538 RepID=A0A1M2VS92_TRAPU|nr:hypothetical protein TRAPUB_13070 [Trametes pubescens]
MTARPGFGGSRQSGRAYSDEDVPNLHGKIALLTGATAGASLHVAKVLASKGARVLLLARREDNPDAALEDIRQHCFEHDHSLNPDPDLAFVKCDLANLEDVKRVADDLCEREIRLDIVVCDAGLGVQTFDVSVDGIDRHFAVSHLGHFLLINRLLPLLRRTAYAPPPASTSPSASPSSGAAPRIICVSSALRAAAPSNASFLSHAELTAESDAASSPLALYARAKLAAVLFVKFGLAPRMNAPAPPPCSSDVQASAGDSPRMHSDRPRAILALATDPGPVHPGQPAQLAQAYGPLLGSAAKLVAAPFERTPVDAARSTLWAATAPELEQDWERWQGAYVTVPGQEDAGCAMARDETRGARLWAMSEDLVRKRLGEDALQPWTWRGDEDEGEAYATPGQGRWLSP